MASGRSARLVGRDAELGRLRELAAEAAAGTARVALVRGEPGIGKTRLVAELLDELRADGALVLTAQGLQLSGGELAYGVASGLLRSLVRQVGVEEVRRLAGVQAAALGPLNPAFADGGSGAGREGVFGAMDGAIRGKRVSGPSASSRPRLRARRRAAGAASVWPSGWTHTTTRSVHR